MNTWIVSSLDEETIQGEETIQEEETIQRDMRIYGICICSLKSIHYWCAVVQYKVGLKMGSSEQLTNPQAYFKTQLSDRSVVQIDTLLNTVLTKKMSIRLIRLERPVVDSTTNS